MPLFMDRHDIPKEISAEHVAKMHQEDLKVEHLYNCRGITYWCDDKNHHAFCLIEAPNKEALQKMHDHAHGEFPHSIIEVDENLVASFLGRIEDPANSSGSELNIIDDSAFRGIMVIETSNYLNRIEGNQFDIFTQKFHNSVTKTVKKLEGTIVKQDNNSYLVSYKSITNAILSALKIQSNLKYITPKFDLPNRKLNIGIGSGLPVTENSTFFDDAITLTTRMCEIVNAQIVISSEVKSLYESENRNLFVNKETIRTLNPSEEQFLNKLMDYVETIWSKSDFNVESFGRELGYSKSQLYRKLKALTKKSPNNFIKDFRLNRAIDMLHRQIGNISEIAFETGFNSPAYFSKCFYEKFGILPSKYIQQHN